MLDVNSSDTLQVGLASPEKIRAWSRGEVKKPETINYRTLKPEREGLFCEKIFGPQKDWECHCGKYKRVRYRGIVCDRCGVEVTRAKVRRERMGHIELAAQVSHIWYFKGIPSRMGLLLDISPRALEKVIYFASYIVIDPGDTYLSEKQLLTETEYREYREKYAPLFKAGKGFRAEMGAEAVKKLLEKLDIDLLAKELRVELRETTGQKKVRAVRRLEVVEAFRQSGNKPEWIILDVVPVIPPDLRPMVQLDGGRFATSDLNDLYRRVINRNNRLKRLLDLDAPDIIVRNEKRMLQEAVDALIDNGRRGRPVTGPGNRPLKSLSDMLKGKQGRFRQNLLGKRVDYSGRSVIVVGPELKLYQCGLPKEMALELFKPFVMKRLVKDGYAHNIKSAKRMVEKVRPEVWDVLEDTIKDHPVLLNRAPTLHRLGIQAFEPVLVEGRAIQIHPLVCTAYNADFDGDQMAVHLPLSVEAQAEARLLMLSSRNILNPKDGRPVVTPNQDLVLGCYYLTVERSGVKGEGSVYKDEEEAIMAYQLGEADLHARIFVDAGNFRKKLAAGDSFNGNGRDKYFLFTTPGKLIFNKVFPDDFPYVNESSTKPLNKEDLFVLYGKNPEEIIKGVPLRQPLKKGMLGEIVALCYRKYGNTRTSEIMNDIKKTGFKYATRAGVTVAISDVVIPEAKKHILQRAEKEVEAVEKQFRRGLITEGERYDRVIDIWSKARDDIAKALMLNLDESNPIYMMAHSGARGNESQITQLAGMRGLMTDPTGKIIDLPIKANFREGLTVLEYFISTHGARKGLADTALKTADSGYLTRRLVDVAQDVIVREEDCKTNQGVSLESFFDDEEYNPEDLGARILGRSAFQDIFDPKTGELLVRADQEIDEEIVDKMLNLSPDKIKIRSVFTCRTHHGVCIKCYGRNLATGKGVDIGEAVGIIAAQSIGEPGTQLTMRTFHTGGVAGDDITQGLPRVEELFEARKPKGQATIAELSGKVKLKRTHGKQEIVITAESGESASYEIPYGVRLIVKEGSRVSAGEEIIEGSVNPHDLLKIKGVRSVQVYLLKEVQNVYRMQGVDINDKHIETIIKQMLRKVKVEDPGDTDLLPGEIIDGIMFEGINKKVIDEGGDPAVAQPMLMGITKASLATESFLSAASFQETTRVLTEASIKGKTDSLLGLKENVIIGRLIPAGTGLLRYRNIKINAVGNEGENASVDLTAIDAAADDEKPGQVPGEKPQVRG